MRKICLVGLYFALLLLQTGCREAKPKLIREVNFPDIFSPTTIFYNQGKIYLACNEGNKIIVLNDSFGIIDSIPIPHSGFGIDSMGIKAGNITGLCLLPDKSEPKLWAMRSGSLPSLDSGFIINLKAKSLQNVSLRKFYDRIRRTKAENRIDFEGICNFGNRYILANRGNPEFPQNQLVIVPRDFYLMQDSVPFQLSKIGFQKDSREFYGIKGIDYSFTSDKLFLTASPVSPTNKTSNRPTGHTYLWITDHFSSMSGITAINPARIIDLQAIDKAFSNKSIVGLCIIHEDKTKYHLLLLSGSLAGTTLSILELPKIQS